MFMRRTHLIVKQIVFKNLSTFNRYGELRGIYEKSFHYRILQYFEDILKAQKSLHQHEISTKIKASVSNVVNTKEKLELVYKDIQNLSNVKNQRELQNLLYKIDNMCSLIIETLRYNEIFYLLNMLLKTTSQNLIINTSFYKKSILLLQDIADLELLNENEKIQLLFLISLGKTKFSSHMKELKSRSYFPDLNTLPLFEKAIVAQGLFMSSVKLESSQIKVIEDVLEKEADKLINDAALLVPLCKAIRISGSSNNLTLKNLSKIIVELNEPLSFIVAVHILSLYAEELLPEKEPIIRLVKDMIEQIDNDINLSLRLKDVDRFLWSISYLGFTLKPSHKDILNNYLQRRIEEYKSQENIGRLISSLLDLHILQCYNKKVIEDCFEEKIFEPVLISSKFASDKPFHWKIRSRLQLLIRLIILEMKMTVPESLKNQIKIQCTPSKNLNLIAKVANSLVDDEIIKSVRIECPIYNLQILGVTLITEKNKYHIDILDNTTCLKNTNMPCGLLNLKIRLLAHLKYKHIFIKRHIFKEDSSEFQEIIEKEILDNINNETSSTFDKNFLEL